MFKKDEKDIFLTNDALIFAKVQQELMKANIPYRVKQVNMGTQNRRTGVFLGQFGENICLEIMYYIYVSQEYVEKANYIIAEFQRKKEVP